MIPIQNADLMNYCTEIAQIDIEFLHNAIGVLEGIWGADIPPAMFKRLDKALSTLVGVINDLEPLAEVMTPNFANPIESPLRMKDLRDIDQDAARAFAVDADPRMAIPLGLSGEQLVDIALDDEEATYFLRPITVTLVSTMTAFDIMRAIATQLASLPAMDDCTLPFLYFEKSGGVFTLRRIAMRYDGEPLTAEQLATLP